MAAYQPETELRQQPLAEGHTAILYIDIQNFNCHPDGALYKASPKAAADLEYWWRRIDACTPKWQQLQSAFRNARAEVLYTVIQSLTRDGRDRGLDYKISGFHVPPGCWDARMIDALAPGEDEMVLPKTSSSVFNSTAIHYLLRNLGVTHLVLCGCVTDQCVEHAVRDACDLGYFVTLVPDACATYSQERHDASLNAIKGYCRQRSTQEVCDELARW